MRIKINNSLIIDGTDFVEKYNQYHPNFRLSQLRYSLNPKPVDSYYLTCFWYTFSSKSTIYHDALASDLIAGWNSMLDSKHQDIIDSFFELEIYNYCRIQSNQEGFFFPSLDLLKLCYWYHKCSSIPGFGNKGNYIKREILGKARVLDRFKKASESIVAYDDLINSVGDFYSELMFAFISDTKHTISFDGSADLLLDSNISIEVKSIHDKFNSQALNNIGQVLQMSLPTTYSSTDLKSFIREQITRKKWIYHLSKAIEKQSAEIILLNATGSQELHRVGLFLEESGQRKVFHEMFEKALSYQRDPQLIPVLVMLENIHINHITSFLLFLVPIKKTGDKCHLDASVFNNTDYDLDWIIL